MLALYSNIDGWGGCGGLPGAVAAAAARCWGMGDRTVCVNYLHVVGVYPLT